jgi:hypothetical protein
VRLIRQAQHDYSCKGRWWIREDVGEIQIQRDQGSKLEIANVGNLLIRFSTECLLHDRVSLVTCGGEYFRQRRGKILVELEFHAVLVGTTRSRASSAA